MFSSKDLFFTTPAGGYRIAKSLRFRRSASAYLSRTPGTAGNRKTFTLSAWIKRGLLSAEQGVFYRVSPTGTDTDSFAVTLLAADTLSISGYATNYRITTQVFRDTSAWYHIVVAVDTTQATANNRIRLYVNGVEVTAFSTTNNPTQNADTGVNSTAQHSIGSEQPYTSSREFDGYMADVYLIDGQALTPSSFGETDATTGVWKPKAYTGTYGTNGFYLKFTDVGSTTAGGANTGYGKDFAGTNNWTTNNFGTTSTGSSAPSYDSMIDTPTPYDNGGNGVGNYCVFSPIDTAGTAGSIVDGNLKLTGGSAAWYQSRSGFGLTSGKWYWEVTILSTNVSTNGICIGIANTNAQTAGFGASNQWTYNNNSSGRKSLNGTSSAYGVAYVTNDVVGVAFDADAGTLVFYVNNSSQGTAASSGLPNPAFPIVSCYGTDSVAINFGQRPFTYTPPSGFKALNTQNLPTPTIAAGNAYMDATTYTGTGSSKAVTNTAGFQPDFVWIKSRSNAYDHALFDAVRGATKQLISNTTGTEATYANSMSAFNSNGFQVVSDAVVNGNGATFVGWQWKGGGTPTVNNTAGAGNVPTAGSVLINGANSTSALAGSIAATRISANQSAGFSVVTYTGNGASSSPWPTVGHGLGVTPSMVIVKNRSSAANWVVWHTSMGGNSYYAYLNATNAASNVGDPWGSGVKNSTVFEVSAGGTAPSLVANTNNYVAYCFAAVAGYSAFGSYIGNNSDDGPFIYLGFRPKFFMVKDAGTAGAWVMIDATRSAYNVASNYLFPNTSAAEASSPPQADFLANGIKLRANNANSGQNNVAGNTYIYAAFAENPFKYALAR